MSALPPELEALKDKWVGPVRVPDDLPDHIVEKSGVYIWVRRYREAPESDSALRGLVIYVGADKKVEGVSACQLACLTTGSIARRRTVNV